MIKRKKKVVNLTTDNDLNEIRSFPLYTILICGLIIIFVGVYLTICSKLLIGFSSAGRFGQGGNHANMVNGPSTIITGIAMCIFPTYELIKNAKRRKKRLPK